MNVKMFTMTFLLLCGTVIGALGAKPSAAEQQAQADAIQRLLESRNYTVRVDQASAMSGGTIATSSVLKIDKDQVSSGLPYYGNGYNTFGGDAAYRFNGTILDYTVTPGKKSKTEVAFTAKEINGKTYKFKIEVFYNGTSFISASGTNLQAMRYRGVLGTSVGVDVEGR